MFKIWSACVGMSYFSIKKINRSSINDSSFNGWCYGGDGEHYQSFETEKEAKSAVIKLMQERLKFAAETIELLNAPI